MQIYSAHLADSTIAPTIGVDICLCRNYLGVRRRLKGLVKSHWPARSKLGDQLDEATRWATRPEKTNGFCEEQLGFGTTKVVIASGGCDGARIHAANSLAGVGG